jgi:hypothetical protein
MEGNDSSGKQINPGWRNHCLQASSGTQRVLYCKLSNCKMQIEQKKKMKSQAV